MLEAITLSHLKHDNILPFLGLYSRPHRELEQTYLIFPWMDHGNIMNCMQELESTNREIPRMRWVSLVTNSKTKH